MEDMLLVPVFFPILAGTVLLIKKEYQNRSSLLLYVGGTLLITGAFALYAIFGITDGVTLFYLTDTFPVYFKLDTLGRYFSFLFTVVWILAGFFSFEYMKKEQKEKRYFGFYLIVFGVLLGLDFAGNLITMYLFYEFMTLTSLPLVLHTQTKEAVMAGLRYLFFSFAGAYMALFGVYFICRFAGTPYAVFGGYDVYADRLRRESGYVSAARLAAGGASGRAGTCVSRAFRNYCKGRRSGIDSCRVPDDRRRFSAGHVGSDGVDDACSDYRIYGFYAGVSGARAQETSCVFYGQPAFLYFIRTCRIAAAGADRCAFACIGACVYQSSAVLVRVCRDLPDGMQTCGGITGNRKGNAGDPVVLYNRFFGADRDSACKRVYQ